MAIRISYSSAKAWWAGDKDKAIKMMLHEDTALPIRFESELKRERAMAYGTGFHKAMELEGKATGLLPAVFGVRDFTVLTTEMYLFKELPTGDVLSGVVDAVAINTELEMVVIVDYKTGTSFDPLQAEVYHYLVHNHPMWLEKVGQFMPTHAFFMTLDKHTDETDNNIIQFSYPRTSEEWDLPDATTYTRGVNWICTVASEINADSLAMARLGQLV